MKPFLRMTIRSLYLTDSYASISLYQIESRESTMLTKIEFKVSPEEGKKFRLGQTVDVTMEVKE